jgi:hypothetical protein
MECNSLQFPHWHSRCENVRTVLVPWLCAAYAAVMWRNLIPKRKIKRKMKRKMRRGAPCLAVVARHGYSSATSPSLKDVCDSQAQALSIYLGTQIIYLGTQIGAQLWSSPYLSRIAAQDYSPPLKPWGETSKSSSPERAIEEPHHRKIFDYSTKCSRVAQRFSAAMNLLLSMAAAFSP